jgi:hypothetical protein
VNPSTVDSGVLQHSAVHAYARAQKRVTLRLVTELVAELGVEDADPLAEQLVCLTAGAAARAMVLDDPRYGRHARAAAEVLLDSAGAGSSE